MKKEVSYKELMEIVMKDIKEKNGKSGDKFEAKDAMRQVADEWKKVKAGQHPDYSAKPNGTPSLNKSVSKSPSSKSPSSNAELETVGNSQDKLLHEVLDLCEKLKEKVLQALNTKTIKHPIKKTRKTRKIKK